MLAKTIINSLTRVTVQIRRLTIALMLCTATISTFASPLTTEASYVGHTLPQSTYQGYQPSMTLFVEQDASGQFHAINAEHARFNRVWMNQDSAKTGNDALKALLKMAVKHLYRSIYRHAGASNYYVPDEEGRIPLNGNQTTQLDYHFRVNSDDITIGMALSF